MGFFSSIGHAVSNVGHAVAHAAGDVGNTIKKAVEDTGHEIGRAASNPIVQGVTAVALAATGVGAVASAGILAAQRGGGALLRPGGNVGDAARGAAEGAAAGFVTGGAGQLVRSTNMNFGSVWGGIKNVGGSLLHQVVDAGKQQVGSVIRNAVDDATARFEGARDAVEIANRGATAAGDVRSFAANNPMLLVGGGVVGALLLAKLLKD